MKVCAIVLVCCASLVCGAAQWPVEISTNGISIKVYQLQPEGLDQDFLRARAALSVLLPGAELPVYGIAHFHALTSNDTVRSEFVLNGILVSEVKLGTLGQENLQRINALLSAEAAGWQLTMTDDELNATLASSRLTGAVEKNDAQPYVTYNGEPHFVAIDRSEARYADNASRRIISHGRRYYCQDKGNWYTADHPDGAWGRSEHVPADVRRIPYVMGWSVDYETPDYSIEVDPVTGRVSYRDKAPQQTSAIGKKWGRDTAKFPE